MSRANGAAVKSTASVWKLSGKAANSATGLGAASGGLVPKAAGEAPVTRQPSVNDRHPATARSSASSVTQPYRSIVVCTSACPSRRDTTCNGTPASSKAEAWVWRSQCGDQPSGRPGSLWRSRPVIR